MNIKDINERLTEIKSEIGTVRVSKNHYVFYTGSWTLCSIINSVRFIGEPSVQEGILVSLNILLTGLCGILWYKN